MPIYDALLEIAKSNLALVNSVIIDSPFTQLMGDVDWFSKVQAIRGINLHIFRTICLPETNRQRLISRGFARDLDKVSEAHFAKNLKDSPMDFKIIGEYTDINTENTLEKQLETMLKTLISTKHPL
jgi:hypothetical protein